MQEAARQPISFKRSYSIADQSTQPGGTSDSKVTAPSGMTSRRAAAHSLEVCFHDTLRSSFGHGLRSEFQRRTGHLSGC
jgi:hypothetical protein